MRSYEIKIDINKLLHYSDSLKFNIDNETLLMLIKSFSIYIRNLYISMIEEKINSSRYKEGWEPISDKGYIEFLGTEPYSKSIITLMVDAMEIRKLRNSIVIRYNPRYRYPDSKVSLLLVLKAIDNGTSKFNARPILKNIIYQLNSNMIPLWKKYLMEKGVV